MLRTLSPAVDFLILGAGWTSQFLIPQLRSEGITHAATSTTGRDGTIKFTFTPDSDDQEPYKSLPSAKSILITFPLKGDGQSRHITKMYTDTHDSVIPNWIQLGSTGIFTAKHWNDSNSDYNRENERAVAEDELLSLGGVVLNLAGLYGGARNPRSWLGRVARTKDELGAKKAVHLVHGDDVAAAIVAVAGKFEKVKGRRWIITDLYVYDWWDLAYSWSGQEDQVGQGEVRELDYKRWVMELTQEEGVRALPREKEELGRVLDGRAFWREIGVRPGRGRVN